MVLRRKTGIFSVGRLTVENCIEETFDAVGYSSANPIRISHSQFTASCKTCVSRATTFAGGLVIKYLSKQVCGCRRLLSHQFQSGFWGDWVGN